MQFQDLVESLKVNKEIKGPEKFVSEHVLTTLSTPEKQKVKEIIVCLEDPNNDTDGEDEDDSLNSDSSSASSCNNTS